MASLHDSDVATDDTSGTVLSAPAIDVTIGDLYIAGVKNEGAQQNLAWVDSGASTPRLSVGNPYEFHAVNTDLSGGVFWGVATATGTITLRFNLGAARQFRKIGVYSFTPTPGYGFRLGRVASTQQSATASPSSGAAVADGRCIAVGFFQLYGSRDLTPGTGWSESAPFNITSAQQSEYQTPTAGGSLTADGTLVGGVVDAISQLLIIEEIPLFPRSGFRGAFGRRRTRYAI